MTSKIPSIGDRLFGDAIIAMATDGDVQSIDPRAQYKRVRGAALGRSTARFGMGRVYHFVQVGGVLTDRQRAVLAFIASHRDETGMAPTIREIGEAMGIKSTNGVNDHLLALKREGYIAPTAGKSRSLVLCGAVDWRTRALKAEAEVERLRELLASQAA